MTKGLLYQRIADKIRNDILKGKYPVGSLLPTEVEFEEMFSVSKITVRKAVEILANEGYVFKKSGQGTRVISDRLFNKLSKAVSFSTLLETKHDLVKKLMSFEVVNVEGDRKLVNAFGKRAHKLTRMYYLDGDPFIYFEHFFPFFETNADKAIEEMEARSIYRWLDDHGFHVAKFEDAFSVERASNKIQQALKTDLEYILLRTRTSYNNQGKVIEISKGRYNTQMQPYIIEYEI